MNSKMKTCLGFCGKVDVVLYAAFRIVMHKLSEKNCCNIIEANIEEIMVNDIGVFYFLSITG